MFATGGGKEGGASVGRCDVDVVVLVVVVFVAVDELDALGLVPGFQNVDLDVLGAVTEGAGTDVAVAADDVVVAAADVVAVCFAACFAACFAFHFAAMFNNLFFLSVSIVGLGGFFGS